MKLDRWKTACTFLLLCAVTTLTAQAQTFTSLLSFDGTDGGNPYAGLIQGRDGNFYGTTYNGGAYGSGTVFKITPAGKLTTIHSFCSQNGEEGCTDGMYPEAGLVQATNGKFYGTTAFGGPGQYGNIFEITANGNLTALYQFCSQAACADGSEPQAGLLQASNGNFYGVTTTGGNGTVDCPGGGCGTVFEMTSTGKVTSLYSFCTQANSQGYCADGSAPEAALIQASNGSLYGTTVYGGAQNGGTVFKITPTGTLTTLYSFCSKVSKTGTCTDGSYPKAALLQASDGNLYGTTDEGGSRDDGTIFKVTAAGKLTTLYSFCSRTNCTDGTSPSGSLIQAADGKFYGTTQGGGVGGAGGDAGTVFDVTAAGTLTTLHSLVDSEGNVPSAGLLQSTNGTFYGTATWGGADNDGSVFSLALGLGPFVVIQPASGKVGESVVILGTHLQGSTAVSFNGTAATFSVVSNSEITTKVPTGATTGTVKVTTLDGILTSNMIFQVEP
jgi:uncharacterized repeat protein (TIGR03803 family)